MTDEQHTTQTADENQIIAERRAKLAELRKQGPAFPNDFKRTDRAADVIAQYGETAAETLEETAVEVAMAGRMMLKRIMGKASFATVDDGSARIQFFVTRDNVGEEAYNAFKRFDLGDIIAAKGTLFRTKTNELSVRVKEIRLLSKSLRPLPEKFHGLTDVEQRYRQRYLDLAMNMDTRRTFITRSKAIQQIRNNMLQAGFLEVETPMMHPIPGGAAAKPFITYHNALDRQLFLRIAPELYLKRLIVGGFDKVFEINRNFRNEGLSPRHNPEFTMMEFYCAYVDYQFLMTFTENLLRDVAVSVTGSPVLTYQGQTIDFSKPFDRLTVKQAIMTYHPEYTDAQLDDIDFLKAELTRLEAKIPEIAGLGALQLLLFEETTEAMVIRPTYIIDYPVEVSPLARASDTNPEITERFELFIAGREIANGFSELNDPEDQAARFREQVKAKDAGDEEAMYYDADYVRALEYGMPPTGGCGIGIDRYIMLLTDAPNIREVLLFPHMRDEASN